MLSWRVLSSLDQLLGSLGLLLGPPGALLGASWSLLRHSWGGLGGTWAPLGSSWRRSKTVQKYDAKKANFKTPPPPTHRKFRGGLGGPKSTKIGSKTSQNLRRFSRAKKLLFKSLLEPSWADLGAFWRPSWGPKYRCGIGRRSVS